jgi:uncharacterized membrane protein
MTSDVKRIQPAQIGLWLVIPIVLGFAITRQSLWMDEGFTVWFASHRSIASFFSALLGSRGELGDPQMVFYLLYMWGWVKAWGASELTLRAANIPFAILLIGTVAWASRRLFQRPNIWALFCLSPFVWFYLNEARPYVAVMAFAAVAVVAELAYLLHPAEYRMLAPWCCLMALLLAWGSHILGVFLIPALVILAVVMTRNQPGLRRDFWRDWSLASLSLMPAFLALGAFFLWASRTGVNMKHAEPGITNLAFVFYEFAGFAGLGPPRTDLREHPHLTILADYWMWLLIGVVAIFAVGCWLMRSRMDRVSRALAISLLAGLSLALIISKIAHFQILGRHVAVFFPMFLMLFLSWIRPSTEKAHSDRTRYLGAVALTALAIAWGISDLRLILLPQYEKESYRAASSISVARAEQSGAEILWAADTHTAYYYGLFVAEPHAPSAEHNLTWPVRRQAINVGNWTAEEAADFVDRRSTPLILVLSRPDLYDESGGWRTLIEKQRPAVVGQMTEFQIYEWPARVLATTDGVARLQATNPPSGHALSGESR